jgi:CRP/FNR family transcriptional regulator, cyclic AMP receptor protein
MTKRGAGVLTDAGELREFKVFDELNERELESVAKIAKTETLGTGARLTEIGSPASRLYLIKDGLVDVAVSGPGGKEVVVDQVGPGDVIGWSTLTGPYLYTASCTCAERTGLIVLNGSRLRELFEMNNHIGYRVLKGMGSVISRRVTAIEKKCAVLS